jgi:cytochrome P450
VLTRRTTLPVSLGGRDIPAGESLAVAVASANRDETAFPRPQRFDVHRKARPHLGFGVGPRHCPAYPMVIALARTALDELFQRMPDLRPAPDWVPAPEGWRLRLPGPLPAVWIS